MRFRIILFIIWSLCSASSLLAGDWQTEVNALLSAFDQNPGEASLTQALAGQTTWNELVQHLRNVSFPAPAKRGETVLKTMRGKDGIERPWVLYLPTAYDPTRPTPLLVVLHGGVSRKDIRENPLKHAGESNWIPLAEQHGWLVLFPYGQGGATWWDDVGMDNVKRQIRLVKSECNIDDDRVFVAGFSDGASAAFLYAMITPDDFGAYVALNGHMGVGSLDAGLPTYATNLANRPGYAVTTRNDSLYATALMAPTLAMARKAGADLVCRELEGTHDFDYGDTELPRIFSFLRTHPRDPHPSRLYWETEVPEFGRCQWFAIDRVLATDSASWHQDVNTTLLDSQVSIGFMPETASNGVGVGKVMPDSYGATIGLLSGDIVISAKGLPVAGMEDLEKAKAAVKRGDFFPLTVRRGRETIQLDGQLPTAEPYFLFKRSQPSAAAHVLLTGNRVEVTGSRVGGMKLYIHPDQFRLEEPVTVILNGRVIFEQKITPDLKFLLRNFLKNRDRQQIYVAEVTIPVTP